MRRGPIVAALTVLGLVGVWEIVVRITGTPEYLVPAPSAIAEHLGSASGLLPAAAVTLLEAISGLLIGASVGLLLAIGITFWGHLEQAVMSIALLVKSTPIIAVAPILTIWMGFGYGPKVVVTALLTFFPVLINAIEGFRSVDRSIHDWARSLDASPAEIFMKIRWPSARPFLFAALKVAAPLAMIGAVVAEWMGASSGLGRHMWVAYANLDMPSLFAAVLVLTLLSAGVYRIVVEIEHRTIRWA